MTATASEAIDASAGEAGEALLEVRNVEVVYHDVVSVLHGVSMSVGHDQVVAVLGANGAGKTTLLRAITGLLDVHDGEITKGQVVLAGTDITGLDAPPIVRLGLAQVMEGRRTFSELTVDENLRTGAATVGDRSTVQERLEGVFERFPALADRRRAVAGYLSGGEQQMLVIGRALMSQPRLLVLDEPSLGLAPLLVEQVRETIAEINRSGTGVLLVEQNAAMALAIAHHGYVMETGRIVRDGPAAELLADRDIQEFYLGMGESGRRSYRDVKSYRRKKRWSA